MKPKEPIKKLAEADDYSEVRIEVSDDFIEFLRTILPSDYGRLKEKEEEYLRERRRKTDNSIF